MYRQLEAALQELAAFRKAEKPGVESAAGLADRLEDLVLEIAAGDPEAADLYDAYLAGQEELPGPDGSRCPRCGGELYVEQYNCYLSEYRLLPDGTIDENSVEITKSLDGDGSLILRCRQCDYSVGGYREGQRFCAS